MIMPERALVSLVRDMLLVESRKARDWIASLPEEERQPYLKDRSVDLFITLAKGFD